MQLVPTYAQLLIIPLSSKIIVTYNGLVMNYDTSAVFCETAIKFIGTRYVFDWYYLLINHNSTFTVLTDCYLLKGNYPQLSSETSIYLDRKPSHRRNIIVCSYHTYLGSPHNVLILPTYLDTYFDRNPFSCYSGTNLLIYLLCYPVTNYKVV